ncbi:MAG: hypothetical protein AAB586_01775 [Patescibacteria group bacterium]
MTGIKDLITSVGGLLNPLIVVLVAAALLVFFWGLVKFIFRVGGDENAVEGGKRLMIWGLIALFVMISVWGIIRFMQNALPLPLPGGNFPVTPSPVLTPV